MLGILDPLDPRAVGLLEGVAAGAQPLPVVDAGGTALRERHDVVVLSHRRAAERGAAGAVAPGEEPPHGGRELARAGVERDQFSAGGMRVEAAQRGAHLGAVGPAPVHLRGLGLGERLAQLLAHGLRRHRAVALDPGRVAVAGREQGPIGDHHPHLEGHRLHRVLAAQQRVGEGIGHQRAMPLARALGPAPLRLQAQALVDELRVERGQVGAHGRHAVLAGSERDVAVRAGHLVAAGGAGGVQLADGGGHRGPPPPHPGTVHPREMRVQRLVHRAALGLVERGRGGGGGVGDRAGHLPARERGEHARHRADETPGRGKAAAGGGGRAPCHQRDVPSALRIRLADQALERGQRRVLVGGVGAGGVDVVALGGLREGHHGAGLERVERAAHVVERVEQVLVLAAGAAPHLEHRPRRGGDGGEQEVGIAQQLREGRRARLVERGEGLVGPGAR
nr:hypothetical protein [Brachybacterium saurashtrense]